MLVDNGGSGFIQRNFHAEAESISAVGPFVFPTVISQIRERPCEEGCRLATGHKLGLPSALTCHSICILKLIVMLDHRCKGPRAHERRRPGAKYRLV